MKKKVVGIVQHRTIDPNNYYGSTTWSDVMLFYYKMYKEDINQRVDDMAELFSNDPLGIPQILEVIFLPRIGNTITINYDRLRQRYLTIQGLSWTVKIPDEISNR